MSAIRMLEPKHPIAEVMPPAVLACRTHPTSISLTHLPNSFNFRGFSPGASWGRVVKAAQSKRPSVKDGPIAQMSKLPPRHCPRHRLQHFLILIALPGDDILPTLHPDIHRVVSRVADILHPMLERREPPRLARLGKHIGHLP